MMECLQITEALSTTGSNRSQNVSSSQICSALVKQDQTVQKVKTDSVETNKLLVSERLIYLTDHIIPFSSIHVTCNSTTQPLCVSLSLPPFPLIHSVLIKVHKVCVCVCVCGPWYSCVAYECYVMCVCVCVLCVLCV